MSSAPNSSTGNNSEYSEYIQLIIFFIFILILALTSAFILPYGDQTTTTPQVSTNTSSYYISIEPEVVNVGQEVSIFYQASNTGNDEKNVKILVLSDIGHNQTGPIDHELTIPANSTQTESINIFPRKIEERTEFPVIIKIIEDNSDEYYIDSGKLIVEPDIPNFRSSYGLVSVFLVTSVLLVAGSIINYDGRIVNSPRGMIFSVFGTLLMSITLTDFLWNYFGFINNGNNSMLSVIFALILLLISIYFHIYDF